MSIKVFARLSSKEIAEFTLKGGAVLDMPDGKFQGALYFEDTAFDYSLLDQCLNLYNGVPSQNLTARSIVGTQKVPLKEALELALKGAPIQKLDVLGKLFTKEFAKDYVMYVNTLQQAINKLQD